MTDKRSPEDVVERIETDEDGQPLAPCPFCGGAPKICWATNGIAWCWIKCASCGAKGPAEYVPHGGAPCIAWNKQTALQPGDPLPNGLVVAQGRQPMSTAPQTGEMFQAFYDGPHGPPFGPMAWWPSIDKNTGKDNGWFHSHTHGTRTQFAVGWSDAP